MYLIGKSRRTKISFQQRPGGTVGITNDKNRLFVCGSLSGATVKNEGAIHGEHQKPLSRKTSRRHVLRRYLKRRERAIAIREMASELY